MWVPSFLEGRTRGLFGRRKILNRQGLADGQPRQPNYEDRYSSADMGLRGCDTEPGPSRVRMRALVAILQSRVLQRTPVTEGIHVAWHFTVRSRFVEEVLFERAATFRSSFSKDSGLPMSPVSL
jgi:hypothetical protein